ncbi:hypothetical protein HPB52_004349 [Rhipicephalus sanguineus]|uniref:Uncharacterized protein n=1 Tax=Rhipicephalus sanguineus TaxID=34632 RepID=A0A9D4SY04_RHISA|nr:hypothetical protein HPB52_004349 [Rhipicephalus sanguineus]
MGAFDSVNGTGRRRRRSEGEEELGEELGNPSLPSVRELVLKFASQSAQSAIDGSNSESLPSPGQEFQWSELVTAQEEVACFILGCTNCYILVE